VTPVVHAGDVLTTTGIGELTLGMSTSTLTSRRVLVGTPGNCSVDETPTLTAEGIAIYTMSGRVTGIHLTTTRHGTKSGIAIGATVADVLATYGSNVAVKTISYGSTAPKNVDLLGRELGRPRPGLRHPEPHDRPDGHRAAHRAHVQRLPGPRRVLLTRTVRRPQTSRFRSRHLR